jgi:hypothetical protein
MMEMNMSDMKRFDRETRRETRINQKLRAELTAIRAAKAPAKVQAGTKVSALSTPGLDRLGRLVARDVLSGEQFLRAMADVYRVAALNPKTAAALLDMATAVLKGKGILTDDLPPEPTLPEKEEVVLVDDEDLV